MIATKKLILKYFFIAMLLTFLDIFISTFALFTIFFIIINFLVLITVGIKDIICKKIINFKFFFVKMVCLILVFLIPNLSGLMLNKYLVEKTIYYVSNKKLTPNEDKTILLNYKIRHYKNPNIIYVNLFNAQRFIYNKETNKYGIFDAIDDVGKQPKYEIIKNLDELEQ